MTDLKGKVVLITGAAHGIGLATAGLIACEGARVVLADVHQGRLDEAVESIRREGHDATGIHVDLRDRDQVYAMVDRVLEEHGLDVLVNNAGVVFSEEFVNLDDKQITDIIEVNLYAPIWACKRALPHMLERGSGHIVNVASAAGKTTNPYISVYCASKFALIGLTDALHQEFDLTGITTTVVNPGWISSGMFKGAKRIKYITKWTSPVVVGEAIVDAVKTGKAEIHVPRMMWIGGFLRALLGPKIMARLWRLLRGDRLFQGVTGY